MFWGLVVWRGLPFFLSELCMGAYLLVVLCASDLAGQPWLSLSLLSKLVHLALRHVSAAWAGKFKCMAHHSLHAH